MIAIVDAARGNLTSVRSALTHLGVEAVLTSDPDVIAAADGIILPGQGAAPTGMATLRGAGLDELIPTLARAGRPLLGICLGMQLLFAHSEEGDTACLNLLPGQVRLLHGNVKLPQIGWNQVATSSRDGGTVPSLWSGVPADPYVYFVHSYICQPADESVVAGRTEYGERFCSALMAGSIWGTQFHPERSGVVGLRMLENFAALCRVAPLAT